MRISDWSSDVCSSDLERIGSCHASGGVGRQGDRRRDVGEDAVVEDEEVGDDRLDMEQAQRRRRDGRHDDVVGGGRNPATHENADDTGHDERERSEEHTSELQSLMRISYAVFCLKKKINIQYKNHREK